MASGSPAIQEGLKNWTPIDGLGSLGIIGQESGLPAKKWLYFQEGEPNLRQTFEEGCQRAGCI